MLRINKKKVLLFLAGLVLIYAAWLSRQIIRFQPYRSALPITHVIEGVYHIHSTHSDGKKTPEKIAAIASRQELDFIILTDHGRPNFDSLACKGYKGGVLLLAGSELSVNRGHMAALDFKLPTQEFSQNAEEAAYQIQKSSGITIIAHPYSKVHWTWGDNVGYSGIEIISTDSMLRKNFKTIIPLLPALWLKPELPLLKLLDFPEKNLRKWDELNRTHKVFGYYSTDAHLLYKPLFALLRLHVELEKPLASAFDEAERQVYSALKQGRFYNAVDGAASTRGFRFWGKHPEGNIAMGTAQTYNPFITFSIQAPPGPAAEIRLIRDGKSIIRSTKSRLDYRPQEPGVYRVEVYLREKTPLAQDCPWILSNPIFLRKADHVTD